MFASYRDQVESDCEQIYLSAATEDIGFLVVGDPLCATTHTDLILRFSLCNFFDWVGLHKGHEPAHSTTKSLTRFWIVSSSNTSLTIDFFPFSWQSEGDRNSCRGRAQHFCDGSSRELWTAIVPIWIHCIDPTLRRWRDIYIVMRSDHYKGNLTNCPNLATFFDLSCRVMATHLILRQDKV